ncbi:hypothetical protein ACVHNB_04490 [Streptomyces sp. YJ-C3]
MADEHDKWLDRDAAERLLRGEPLKAVTDDDIRQAERIITALDALTVLPAGPEGELPGEEAALKAFREARAVRAVDDAVDRVVIGADRPARAGRHRAGASGAPAPAGPGREAGDGPRWGRPVRFGMAAALAACMVGGVAVAAGTGVLPSPFGGGNPTPAASVSGAASPDRPLVSSSPSPSDTDRDEVLPDGSATPDGSGAPSADRREERPERKSTTRAPAPRTGDSGRTAEGVRRRLVEACLRYRGGQLGSDEQQRLRDSARKYGRSAADLNRFCDRVLGRSDGTYGFGGSNGSGGSDGSGGSGGSDGHNGGQDGDEDDDAGGDDGQHAGNTPAPPAPEPSPGLSYSAAPGLPTATATPSPSVSSAP